MTDDPDPTPPSLEPNGNAIGIHGLREQLAKDLAGSLKRALASYHRFSACCVADDPKSYAAYQSGCRAALAHIHLLIKLAEWAGSDLKTDPAEISDADLDRLLSEARTALNAEDWSESES